MTEVMAAFYRKESYVLYGKSILNGLLTETMPAYMVRVTFIDLCC